MSRCVCVCVRARGGGGHCVCVCARECVCDRRVPVRLTVRAAGGARVRKCQ